MKVLVIVRQQNTMDKITGVLESEGIDVSGVLTDEAAYDELMYGQYDYVIAGGGIEEDTCEKIRNISQKREIKVIEIDKAVVPQMTGTGTNVLEDYYREEILPRLKAWRM